MRSKNCSLSNVTWILLSQVVLLSIRYGLAGQPFVATLENEGKRLDVLREEARYYQDNEMYDEALSKWRAIWDQNPEQDDFIAPAWDGMFQIYMNKKDYAHVFDLLDQVWARYCLESKESNQCRRNLFSLGVMSAKARAYTQMKDYQKVLEIRYQYKTYLEDIIKIGKPECMTENTWQDLVYQYELGIPVGLGDAQLELHQYGNALENFLKAEKVLAAGPAAHAPDDELNRKGHMNLKNVTLPTRIAKSLLGLKKYAEAKTRLQGVVTYCSDENRMEEQKAIDPGLITQLVDGKNEAESLLKTIAEHEAVE